MITEKLNVEGMSCGHCVASIEKAVGGLQGVESVSVSLENHSVDVTYAPSELSLETVKEEIEDQGYDVK
ncbi:copper chaperone CopZ [Shouchella shacheensis]|uniref:copper chaperone CopZ n=1 Tax=Shouchella shacheensis TaxID=1649580 RepID=UPI00073FF02D|nr:copper chaperone CopZ [Shouchella shacheensis]